MILCINRAACLPLMSNEMLGDIYEATIGHNPFRENAQIDPATNRPFVSAEETRKNVIEILSDENFPLEY